MSKPVSTFHYSYLVLMINRTVRVEVGKTQQEERYVILLFLLPMGGSFTIFL